MQVPEVTVLLLYTLIGAVIGVIVGHIVPPGYVFWFVVGAISGFLSQRYFGRRY